MAHGYAIVGKAGRMNNIIPSLIGVEDDQTETTPNDLFFARYDIDDFSAGCISSLSRSRWVNYDSLPLEVRDPILTVRASVGDFYIPKSELIEIAEEYSDTILAEMIAAI